jgi:hypothetical protein
MNDSSQLRSKSKLGVVPIWKPGRQLIIETKMFTTADQCVPVRVVIGRDRVAGVHMFPVWGLHAVENKTQAGK